MTSEDIKSNMGCRDIYLVCFAILVQCTCSTVSIRDYQVNTMATDAYDPCGDRSTAATVSTLQVKALPFFHKAEFLLPVPPQYRETIDIMGNTFDLFCKQLVTQRRIQRKRIGNCYNQIPCPIILDGIGVASLDVTAQKKCHWHGNSDIQS